MTARQAGRQAATLDPQRGDAGRGIGAPGRRGWWWSVNAVACPAAGHSSIARRDDKQAGAAADYLLNAVRNYRRTHAVQSRRRQVQLCKACLLYTSPSPRDRTRSRMPSSA